MEPITIAVAKFEQPDREKDFLKKAKQKIEKHHADENFSVKTLAVLLSVSREHLWRIVKKVKGISPREWIVDYRLQKAKRLLREGMSARDTAFSIGFEDPAYFSRWFKNKTGMTVNQFKNFEKDNL